jgi:hypothetical protein
MFSWMLFGCSSVRTAADQERTATFNQYRTYAWLPADRANMQTDTDAQNQSMVFQNAVDKELETRGMVADTNEPDILLRYHVGTQNQITYHNESMHSYSPSQSFSGGRHMWHSNGNYSVNNGTYRTPVREGMLSVDAIDRKTSNVIWRGISKERVDTLTNMNADMSMITRSMFEKYPTQPVVIAK